MLSATSDGGRIVTGCDDGSVWLWSRSQRACVHTLHGHADVVTSVALLGATLVSGSLDDTVKVWRAG